MKFRHTGFTLIELLVVVGVLAILMGITLLAINPLEQSSRAKDVAVKATVQDFIAANSQYYVDEKQLPWLKNTECEDELSQGGPLSDMPSCITELLKTQRLSEDYAQKDEISEIHVTKCGDTAVLCYNPRSKVEAGDGQTKYTKFGVNDPGCPGANGGEDCYWCKPVMNSPSCNMQVTPTPTPTITPTPTVTPTPVPSFPQLVSGYANDETKLFRTYAVFFFDHPGFPPPPGAWSLHFSLRPDFGGDYTQTNRSFATSSDLALTSNAISYVAYRKITNKYVAFQSLAGQYPLYANNCGKPVYYRIANWYNPSATDKKEGPTYTGVIDCTTKVGIVDPPLSWYTVWDYATQKQKKYEPSWDFDNSNEIDWVDYWLGAFSTKIRYGGWQPPE